MNKRSHQLLALLVLAAALLFWLPGGLEFQQKTLELSAMRSRLSNLDLQISEQESALNAARLRTEELKRLRREASASVQKATSALAKSDPEARWALPPSEPPQWDAVSPYIWLPKDFLSRLRIPIFSQTGRLSDAAAATFAIDPASRKTLDDRITQQVDDYRATEVANAERLNPAPVDLATNTQAMTLRIEPMPEAANQFKAQVGQTLRETLGSQRADLMMQSAQDWLDNFGTNQKTFSVAHRTGGGFSIKIEEGESGGLSTEIPGDDPQSLGQYIPGNLLPLFVTGLGLDPSNLPP